MSHRRERHILFCGFGCARLFHRIPPLTTRVALASYADPAVLQLHGEDAAEERPVAL
jgi:hypothetical protein